SQDQTLQKKVDWLALRFVQFSRNEDKEFNLIATFIIINHSFKMSTIFLFFSFHHRTCSVAAITHYTHHLLFVNSFL
ncbi:hypothetical protein P4518_07505, partial [Geobacillus thermodenitrificans]|uniref:hypothetical protein n=1 Tax=Geobacillus thermodenitrificans TaxID=33940 RepID=UPI002E246394|nr:hypothetical protein [Geobacillus thermodenitrificans]